MLTDSQIAALLALPFVSVIDDWYGDDDLEAFFARCLCLPAGMVLAHRDYRNEDREDLSYHETVCHLHYCAQAEYDAIVPPGFEVEGKPLTFNPFAKLAA
jgi:hypothetical protein